MRKAIWTWPLQAPDIRVGGLFYWEQRKKLWERVQLPRLLVI